MCAFARNKDKCTAPVDAPMEKRGHLQMPRPEIATAASGRAPLKLSVCVICELPCSIRHVVFRASVCLGFFFLFWNLSVQAGLLRASRAFLACFFMCPLLALPWDKNVPWFFLFLLLSAAMRTSGYPVGTHSRTSNTFRLRGIAWHECVVRHHFVTPSRHCHVNVTHHLCTVSTAITMTAMTGIPDGPHTWEVSSETNLTFLVVIMTMFANFSAFIFFNRFYRARENDRWREVRVGSRWICIRTCQSCP